jgi:carbonic anhydrase
LKDNSPHADRITGEDALDRLLQGNERFASGRSLRHHTDAEWCQRLTGGQHPFAAILACSDSRVPVELLFDQGFGDLFVVRVAGNVVGDDEIGSIEFALSHLATPLVFVLGHDTCGVVTAALAPKSEREKELQGIKKLVSHIDPALAGIDRSLDPTERIRMGVEANVRWSIKQLTDLEEVQIAAGEVGLVIAGGVYELDTRKIRMVQLVE